VVRLTTETTRIQGHAWRARPSSASARPDRGRRAGGHGRRGPGPAWPAAVPRGPGSAWLRVGLVLADVLARRGRGAAWPWIPRGPGPAWPCSTSWPPLCRVAPGRRGPRRRTRRAGRARAGRAWRRVAPGSAWPWVGPAPGSARSSPSCWPGVALVGRHGAAWPGDPAWPPGRPSPRRGASRPAVWGQDGDTRRRTRSDNGELFRTV
jgi:hypothetical protein